MQIKRVDDKPMMIHVKEKPKLRTKGKRQTPEQFIQKGKEAGPVKRQGSFDNYQGAQSEWEEAAGIYGEYR